MTEASRSHARNLLDSKLVPVIQRVVELVQRPLYHLERRVGQLVKSKFCCRLQTGYILADHPSPAT